MSLNIEIWSFKLLEDQKVFLDASRLQADIKCDFYFITDSMNPR